MSTTYVLSMAWDERVQDVGLDQYKRGPQWRRIVHRCEVCFTEIDETRVGFVVAICSARCWVDWASDHSTYGFPK